jgi:NADH dehydrogenase FAD-containing subunit
VLVTPFARQMYSGMVPGLVAGHYTADAVRHPAAAAGAGGARAAGGGSAVQGLDAAARTLHLADGEAAPYDVLSSTPAR